MSPGEAEISAWTATRIIRRFLFKMLKSFCHQLQSKTFEAWRYLPMDEKFYCQYWSRKNIPSANKLLLEHKCLLLAPIVDWKMVTHFPVVIKVHKIRQQNLRVRLSLSASSERVITYFANQSSYQPLSSSFVLWPYWNWARLQILFLQRKKAFLDFPPVSEWPVAGSAWAAGVTLDLTLRCPLNSPQGWDTRRPWTNPRPVSGSLTNQSSARPAVWQLQTAGRPLQASLYTAECAAESLSGPWLSLISSL